ncbi:MAG: hypothetical protein ACYTAF_10455, partial [Planctomycetota bacterium]
MKTAAAIILLLFAQDRDLSKDCGSEIRWETTVARALARARKDKKPVCWYVDTVANSPMDRTGVVDDYMMMGPFMAPDVVDVLNRRFVPVRTSAAGAHKEKYGLKPLEFIEPGLVFLTPEGELLHKIDRIYTYNEEWFVDQMFLVLGENEFEKRLETEKDPL